MKLLPFEAVVTAIGEPETKTNTSSNASFTTQILTVKVDSPVDDIGNPVGEDEVFDLQLINGAIEKQNLLGRGLLGFRVMVSAYLNSNAYKSSRILNLRLASIKKL